MKNMKWLSLALSLVLFLQCFPVPARAAETEASTEAILETTQPVTVPQAIPDVTVPSELDYGTVSIYQGCRGIESQIPLTNDRSVAVTAQGIVVFEKNTGTMVYSYNADAQLPPGTLSKILTALIVVENCDLDAPVTCSSRNISRLPAGTQHVDLKEGEVLPVRDLLYCLLLQSANDAAIALSEYVSGNQEAFVTLMNERARKLGCTGSVFANVHGLDNKAQHTTARDMAKIMVEVTSNATLMEILSTKGYTVEATNRSDERKLRTVNYLIDELNVNKYLDPRVIGGLPSYSEATRAGLICEAKDEKKGMDLILILLGSQRRMMENGWQVEYYGNFDEMTELINYIFDNFKVKRILYDGQALSQFPVIHGENHVVGQPHVNVDTVLPKDVSMDNLIVTPKVSGGGLTAPIEKDQKISTVEIWYRNSCLAEAELFAMSGVRKDEQSGLSVRDDAARDDNDTSGFLKFVRIVSGVILIPLAIYLTVNAILRARARSRKRRRRSGRRRNR